jgi:hypothetical protein
MGYSKKSWNYIGNGSILEDTFEPKYATCFPSGKTGPSSHVTTTAPVDDSGRNLDTVPIWSGVAMRRTLSPILYDIIYIYIYIIHSQNESIFPFF